MDENEAGGGGYSGDPPEPFHRNEAIAAVADEAFLGEEDDDYEDLYNDVNVGENFLQSLRGNEGGNSGQRNEELDDNKADPTPTPPPLPPPHQPPPQQPPPVVSGVALPDEGGSSRVQNLGFGVSSNTGDLGVGRVAAVAGGGGGLRVELGHSSSKVAVLEEGNALNNHQQMIQHQHPLTENGENGGTILFVGDLHWWTTDAELETELCKYGPVKEVKFFDERASGKSKGYCQVEFYNPSSTTSCKESLNGQLFNGRPCVVAYASPFSVKRMGEAQVNRNQNLTGSTPVNQQPWKGPGDIIPNKTGVVNNVDNNGRGFGRGNWGNGNGNGRGMGNRGGMGMRNRPGGIWNRPMMHPQAMMGQGFDPMGGRYGGFPGGPAFGFPGVAPHVNPAFFGRGMPMNGMGMMQNHGVEMGNMGMWPDPNMGGWQGDDYGGVQDQGQDEDAASEHQYVEGSQEKGPWPNNNNHVKENDRSGSSERRHRDERRGGYEREKDAGVGQDKDWSERRNKDVVVGRERQRERDRDRERERDRDRHSEHHRHRNRDAEYDDERVRGRPARTHDKSRVVVSHEEERRSRSKDADYGKRRRIISG